MLCERKVDEIDRQLAGRLVLDGLRDADDFDRGPDAVVETQALADGVAVRLIGTMGAVGLLLAIAGLYGLLSYNVTRRTREIGIRMAIGAGPQNVLRMVMSKGISLVAIGTAIGLVMGFAVERMMNAMLFSSGGIDFVAYLIVVPSMLAVTLLAAYLPARRATGIPPTLALRCD